MKDISVVNILYVVLSIVSVIVTGVVVPLIKKKWKQQDINNAMEMVEIAVKAAEQIYRQSGQGNLKKQYVKEFLKDHKIKISEDELNNMIEATVLELNKWKQELKAQPVVNVINTEEVKEKPGE